MKNEETKTFVFRTDKKLMMALELAAAHERKTIPEFIRWAIKLRLLQVKEEGETDKIWHPLLSK